MSQKVVLPVILTKMAPRVDRSWVLSLETRELNGKDIEVLANRLGTEGWIVHSPNDDITAADVPTAEADSGLEGKTSSERLRNVLYVLWSQRNEPGGDFETWRIGQMNNLIDIVKAKLEPRD